jgi:hypothetical protein
MNTQNTKPDSDYAAFLDRKTHLSQGCGFEPLWMPDFLFPFQRALTTWAIQRGRAAIFADCGLGKSPMQLVWAQNVVEKTCKPVLILTPLAVGAQTVREANKFGIEAAQSRAGKIASRITITNYQQLHKFDPNKFGGVVCDESSILKNFAGKLRAEITAFMQQVRFRLLCTATAAPNDYLELGTSSEALSELRRVEMLATYFTHDGGDTQKWTLKGHARHKFWQWVCTWARAIRKPSDMGFPDDDYILPPLITTEHIVSAAKPLDGFLFDMPAVTLDEQRQDRRRTIDQRCEMAARLAAAHQTSVVWCHLNPEGDLLEKLIPESRQIAGADSDDEKEEIIEWFIQSPGTRRLISKPSMLGFGLNLQFCSHQTFFPSHSFEQWYQAIRRCWRFGQKNPVHVDVIASEGEAGVLANMKRKSEQADAMFARLVELINSELQVEKREKATRQQEIPKWL